MNPKCNTNCPCRKDNTCYLHGQAIQLINNDKTKFCIDELNTNMKFLQTAISKDTYYCGVKNE